MEKTSRPLVTFHVETWDSYYPACVPVWDEHYAEFAPFHAYKMGGGPDAEMYAALEQAGKLLVCVARSAGKVVGYALIIIRKHLHYKDTLCGFEDSYYLLPEFRKGLTGYLLIKFALQKLRERGVRKTYWMTKQFKPVTGLLLRFGMKQCDTVFCLDLEE